MRIVPWHVERVTRLFSTISAQVPPQLSKQFTEALSESNGVRVKPATDAGLKVLSREVHNRLQKAANDGDESSKIFLRGMEAFGSDSKITAMFLSGAPFERKAAEYFA